MIFSVIIIEPFHDDFHFENYTEKKVWALQE